MYKATSTTYAIRGGSSGNSFNCGFTFVFLSNAFSVRIWYNGAALSFKHLLFIVIIFIKVIISDILYVVVPVVVIFIVVLSVLVCTITLVIHAGTMAPLYHLNLFIKIIVYYINRSLYIMKGDKMDKKEYKPPFIDRLLSFIVNKFFYPCMIVLWIGIVVVLFNKTIGGFIIGILGLIVAILYILYTVCDIYRKYKTEKEIKKSIDISKYFDDVKYELYNDEDDK